jgi:hypothetical protein
MRLIRPGQRHWQQDSEGGAAAVAFALVIKEVFCFGTPV